MYVVTEAEDRPGSYCGSPTLNREPQLAHSFFAPSVRQDILFRAVVESLQSVDSDDNVAFIHLRESLCLRKIVPWLPIAIHGFVVELSRHCSEGESRAVCFDTSSRLSRGLTGPKVFHPCVVAGASSRPSHISSQETLYIRDFCGYT